MSGVQNSILPVGQQKNLDGIEALRGLTFDLNVPMLPELRMTSGSQFQTVGVAEEKRRAVVRNIVMQLLC